MKRSVMPSGPSRFCACLPAILLVLSMATASAQTPSRDHNPLPPGSDIRSQVPVGGERANGVSAAAGAAARDALPDFSEIQKARDAFDELLRAYESGNVGQVRRRLDPSMIGYQVFLDGVRRDANALKNLRIQLIDTQVTVGPDVAVIQTAWEKRYLAVSDFQPGLLTGRSTILMHRGAEGWRLAAVAQDNLFTSATGMLTRFTLAPSVVSLVPGADAPTQRIALQLEIADPDLAGLGEISVSVTSSEGDREVLAVPAVAPGVFRLQSVTMAPFMQLIVPGNQVLDLAGAAATFTFSYIDADPGGNRLPVTLNRVLLVQ